MIDILLASKERKKILASQSHLGGVHLRCRRRGCRDRNRRHRRPAWASSQDAILEGSDRPAAASAPCSRISSPWVCYVDSSDAISPDVGGDRARRSGISVPERRPTRAHPLPIEAPAASPASWEERRRLWSLSWEERRRLWSLSALSGDRVESYSWTGASYVPHSSSRAPYIP